MPDSLIGIFAATGFEYRFIKNRIGCRHGVKCGDVICTRGHLGTHDVLVVKTGVGLGNAKKALDRIMENGCPVSWVINVGIAGALDSRFPLGSVVLADRAINENDHTEYCAAHPSGLELKEVLSSYTRSRAVSVNRPVFSKSRRDYYKHTFHADIVDMEAAALIEDSNQHNLPCCVIKGISDHADESAGMVEGIMDPEENLRYPAIFRKLAHHPLGFSKGLLRMYLNSKAAMKNAVHAMEMIIMGI